MVIQKTWQLQSFKDGLEEEFKMIETNKKLTETGLTLYTLSRLLGILHPEDKGIRRSRMTFIIVLLITQISNST